MKFRISPKDFVMLIIYSIFLLILCSLSVINFASLINEGKFYGINFFAGFFPPYLLPTLIVFISVFIVILLSVSSYIFEKEKGSGIGLKIGDKEEKGYSRWLKESEIKKFKDVVKIDIKSGEATGAGIPLINDGKTMYVDNSENHTLVIGATGSGKSTCLVNAQIESIARAGESLIVTDPKGELYGDHSEMLRSKGYNIVVLNFREPTMGNSWNPLALPYDYYKKGNVDKAIELLEDVASNILYDPNNKSDPFWEKSAADYFSGLTLGLFQDAKEEEINLKSINYMANAGEENFASSNYIKEYFNLKGEKDAAYVFASNTINTANETKQGILSVFREKIRKFASREQLSEMLSYSDFDIHEIGKKKTAVFIVVHDEKTTYHSLATIFLKQVYETLISVAQQTENRKLPYRVNFILDEFANMPPIKDISTMVTAARSRKIRFTIIVQNFSQLNDVYGKEIAETIRSNCANIVFIMTNELSALEEISKLCGEVKSKEKEKTASVPLITVSDLQKLKQNEVIILKQRLNPFKVKLTPSYKIDWGDVEYGKGKFVERTQKEVALFDVKEYVKNEKRKRLFDNVDNMNNNPTKGVPIGNIFEGMPNKPTNMFGMPNNMMQVTDNKQNNTPLSPGFDIDSLVKRIDERIAELEKEEELEKQKQNTNITNNKVEEFEKLDATVVEKFDDFFKQNDIKVKPESKVVVDNDSVVVDNIDDEYFDDFFDEDNK